MNRYVPEGIARDLEAGKRVIVIASTMRIARLAFEEIAAAHPWPVARGTAGVERIESASGGVATFHSASRSGSLRGLTADTLVLVDGLAGWRGIKSDLAHIAPEVIG